MKSEKQIEQSLVKAVKNMGGIAPKFVSPGFDGMPDRIVLLPHGLMAFVEVKAPGKKTALCRCQGMACFSISVSRCISLTI